MTWDHPRGYDPLVAAADAWAARTGTEIRWERRSLQDFETYPVEQLAREYDLIVIDHPHVGQVADAGCLLALDKACPADALAGIAAGSVGGSYESYNWKGSQWALPIDAAAQVQAWVPGRIDAPARHWREVMALGEAGRVALALRPPHSLMSLFTLCGMEGVPLDVAGPDLFPTEAARAYARLSALAARVDPESFCWDPIAIFERMAERDSVLAVSPLIYGYVSYALESFRPVRTAFADVPVIGAAGPAGSALGGTGIAVSAFGSDPEGAAAFAAWVAGAEVQRGLYAEAGGQPAHAEAWADEGVNAGVAGFYRETRETLDRAWLRPRHDGYMAFQQAASERLNDGLRRGEDGASVIAALNRLFRESL